MAGDKTIEIYIKEIVEVYTKAMLIHNDSIELKKYSSVQLNKVINSYAYSGFGIRFLIEGMIKNEKNSPSSEFTRTEFFSLIIFNMLNKYSLEEIENIKNNLSLIYYVPNDKNNGHTFEQAIIYSLNKLFELTINNKKNELIKRKVNNNGENNKRIN